MYGAIIGDLAGSIYEYEQTKEIKSVMPKELIDERSFFSDDTILTIAILDAILNDKDYDKYLRMYINNYKNYKPFASPYFEKVFSPNMIDWAESDEKGYSKGNGAMMRISPVGYMFDKENEVVENARLATQPSHDSIEAINAASTIALIIFYARLGMPKEEIFRQLNIKPKYHHFNKFNTTCDETINNCLYVAYIANDFEDAIRRTLIMGGDTDTNCCIVGSMAEALYGVSDDLIEQANSKLPNEFVKVLKKADY